MGITYRPEIDGLRAIAVLAVVLYHAGIGGAGFVGVDVFFVISGYLITSLLLSEWRATKAIDLMAFYARRVRRIFPAAAVVVLATLGVAYVLLPPAAQSITFLSAGSALVFAANLFFQANSGGYFDGPAEEMPLLHLWSLSVEEQFYFLWPVFLILVLRYRPRWLLPAIAGLGLLSLVLAEGLMRLDPEMAFYQMPARFWELAAGGLIAALPPRAVSRHVATTGLLVTLAACVWPPGHFPAVGALPAVGGASLLILAVHGRNNLGPAGALLRSRPMVFVGLISYSLYLAHWPLLALYRATSVGEGDLRVRLALCAFAVIAAVLLYRYVEQPFRRLRGPKVRVVTAGAAVSFTLALSACAMGWQAKQAPRADDPLAFQAEHDMPPRACHSTVMDAPTLKCPPSKETRIAIWGDSMAYAWTPLAWALDGKASAFSRDSCAPFLDYLPEKVFPADLKCRDFNALVVERVKGLDTLILVALWGRSDTRLETGLRRTLEMVSPSVRRILIIGPTPRLPEGVPNCIRQKALAECAISRAEFSAAIGSTQDELMSIASDYANVEVIDPTDHFCSATTCPPVKEGLPLYWDTHHVSVAAAKSFVIPDPPSGGTH